jgi:ADP-ribose pyrophosphatase YjhB (NUDIX family)
MSIMSPRLEQENAVECQHSLISDVAVFSGDRVLLVKYRDMDAYDNEAGWFLPDDALRHLEHPTRAAKRIAKEQLGVELGDIRLDHVESFKGNDGSWHMAFHHAANLQGELQPAADVASAQWFALGSLPPRAEVAHHGWALTVLRRIGASRPREDAGEGVRPPR